MGLHKLEIEVDDETLSRIDAAAARAKSSRKEVLAEKLRDFPPADEIADAQRVKQRLAFLDEIFERASLHSSNLTSEQILREVREFRGDE